MKIALMHYHLRSGGVATVIRHQIQALLDRCEVLFLTGDPDSPPDLSAMAVHVPGIGYDAEAPSRATPGEAAAGILAAIRKKWPGGCDLIHVHNPTLAKNRRLLDILDALKARGIRLFLQIHDFAEDGRPGAYFHRPYPEDCHWGVINSRDYRILADAGLNGQGLHAIPNAVRPLEIAPDPAPTLPRVLYPIRAIRRKNIGEAILLSHFLPGDQKMAITLPPTSPADQSAYADWKRFARKRSLRVEFEVGCNASFPSLVHRARSLVTTSITEGFGFSFVEGWTAGKMIWGRRLDSVYDDFSQKGLDLTHFYGNLAVPLDWIGGQHFASQFSSAMKAAARRFDHHLDLQALEAFLEVRFSAGTIDFGQLHETHQKQVLDKVVCEKSAATRIIDLNPWLKNPGDCPNESRLVQANDRAVRKNFNLGIYGDNLVKIYQKVRKVPVRHRIDKIRLLRAFLRPETFCLLKWCDYDKAT